MCGSVRYREAETTAPAICALLPQNCMQNLHEEMTSNTLSRWYELMVHQTVHAKPFRKLFYLLSNSLALGHFQ
jgi:hypothetical protein